MISDCAVVVLSHVMTTVGRDDIRVVAGMSSLMVELPIPNGFVTLGNWSHLNS